MDRAFRLEHATLHRAVDVEREVRAAQRQRGGIPERPQVRALGELELGAGERVDRVAAQERSGIDPAEPAGVERVGRGRDLHARQQRLGADLDLEPDLALCREDLGERRVGARADAVGDEPGPERRVEQAARHDDRRAVRGGLPVDEQLLARRRGVEEPERHVEAAVERRAGRVAQHALVVQLVGRRRLRPRDRERRGAEEQREEQRREERDRHGASHRGSPVAHGQNVPPRPAPFVPSSRSRFSTVTR